MKKKFYTLHGDAVDALGNKHVVTVVGELVCGKETKTIEWDANVVLDTEKNKCAVGKLTFPKTILFRQLSVGIAICNPQDKYDEEVGVKIAKSRIRKGEDAGVLHTNSVTMLTQDQIYAILLNKLKWVCDHIDTYINTDTDKNIMDDEELTENSGTDTNNEENLNDTLNIDTAKNSIDAFMKDWNKALNDFKDACSLHEAVLNDFAKDNSKLSDISLDDEFIFGY